MPKKKLTRERLQQIIKEEKQRLKRIKREHSNRSASSSTNNDTLNESKIIGSGQEGSSSNFSRIQELAGVNDAPEKKRTVTEGTLEMMDEVRDKITDRRVLEQLAKTIDDDTFRDALREIAEDENIQLY